MIDFLIFYEVKNREFESIVLLKNMLVSMGYKVDYVSFMEKNNPEIVKKYRNNVRVAVMPSLYHDKEIADLVYFVAGKVENIVNLRWEQIFRNVTEQDFSYYVYPKQSAKLAFHCCWGEKSYKTLLEAGVDKKFLGITGAMQMDILRDEFTGYFVSKEELFQKYNISIEKPCVLFISSFALSSFSEKRFENHLSQFTEKKEIEQIREFVTVERESKYYIIQWLKELAEKEECTIIYRPHPTEVNTLDMEYLKESKNIKIIGEQNIKQWIKVCDQVYTWFSTSVAEAYFANIPVNILRPIEMNYRDDLPIYNGAQFVNSKEDFLKCYQNNINDANVKSTLNEEIIKSYYSVDKIPAYKRTALFLEEILQTSYRFPWKKIGRRDMVRSYIWVLERKLKNICWNILEKIYMLGIIRGKGSLKIEQVLSKHKERVVFYNKEIITSDMFDKLEKEMLNFQ